jgi:hypothetical protein
MRFGRHPLATGTGIKKGENSVMAHQAEALKMNLELTVIPGTSLKVSPVAIGTWAVGRWMWGGTDEA